MSGLRLLNEGQDNDATAVSSFSGILTSVTLQDQISINSFSKLNLRLDNLQDLIASKKTEKEYLEDLSSELELADEDEPVKYRIGDCFVSMSVEAVQARVQKDTQALEEELGIHVDEVDAINKEMAKLKAVLYGKFGNTINLERD
ncbi:hypothetical protein HDV03_003342 [Kappamyces sp. JEL0829]|nr:hypothetical protein HDV03_003342 [Kappamyces sp. JEL0829]